jgi:biopolymer transport protein ExbB/TolQ
MLRTFNETAGSRTVPPEAVAAWVGLAMWVTAAGLIAIPFGVGAVIAAIVWLGRIRKATQVMLQHNTGCRD